MAFFKLAKKKKDDSLDIPAPAPDVQEPRHGVPVDQVLMMKQQGYTSNQIVQMLQSQGYNNSEIFDAINKAGLTQNVPVEQPEAGMPEYGQYEPQQTYEQPYQSFQPPKEIQAPASIDEERIQEVAEAIIDEKWDDLVKDIQKVIEWKERSEDRIAKDEHQIIDLKINMDSLTKSMMAKISSYDQNIVDVGTDIKAMEKVFQKVLPSLTESVNKLDRMTKSKDQPQKK